VANALSVTGIGLIKIFWATKTFWMYITLGGLVILYIVSFAKGIKKKKSLSKKDDKIKQLLDAEKNKLSDIQELRNVISKYKDGYNDFLKSYLRTTATRLNLTPADRISVYEHRSNYFQLIGRYSDDQSLMEPGRPTYPDNEGYIALGFHKNEYCENGFPCPDHNFDQYYDRVAATCNISKGVCKKLTMKSRSYCCFSIINPITHDRNAVIVIESLNPELDISDAYKAIHEEVSVQVNSFLFFTAEMRPDPSYAKQFGL